MVGRVQSIMETLKLLTCSKTFDDMKRVQALLAEMQSIMLQASSTLTESAKQTEWFCDLLRENCDCGECLPCQRLPILESLKSEQERTATALTN